MLPEGTEPVSQTMPRKIIRVAEHEPWPQLTRAQHKRSASRLIET
jgi:hypothetical protein